MKQTSAFGLKDNTMGKIKIMIPAFLMCLCYMLNAFYLRQGHINGIYQNTEYSDIWERNCKSTVILIDDAPLSHHAQKKLWQRNNKEIIEKWDPFTKECDSVLFVNNNVGHVEHKEDLDTWITEGAICLNGAVGGCISWDDRLFYVEAGDPTWKDEVSIVSNGFRVHLTFID